MLTLNPIALRKAKIVYNFGLSECNRVKAYKMKTVDSANRVDKEEVAHDEPPNLDPVLQIRRGWSGGAKVLGKFQCQGILQFG